MIYVNSLRHVSGSGGNGNVGRAAIKHAVFLSPGTAPITKADFAADFRKISAKARIEQRQQVKDLAISGDLAYAWSHMTVTFTPKAGGARTERSGHVLAVFRRSAGGGWQLTRAAKLIPATVKPDRV